MHTRLVGRSVAVQGSAPPPTPPPEISTKYTKFSIFFKVTISNFSRFNQKKSLPNISVFFVKTLVFCSHYTRNQYFINFLSVIGALTKTEKVVEWTLTRPDLVF